MISPFVVNPRLVDLNGAQTGLDPPCRQVAIADDQTMPLVIDLLSMLMEVIGHRPFNGSLQHLLSPLPEGLFEQGLTDLACVEVDGFGCLRRGGCVHVGAFR